MVGGWWLQLNSFGGKVVRHHPPPINLHQPTNQLETRNHQQSPTINCINHNNCNTYLPITGLWVYSTNDRANHRQQWQPNHPPTKRANGPTAKTKSSTTNANSKKRNKPHPTKNELSRPNDNLIDVTPTPSVPRRRYGRISASNPMTPKQVPNCAGSCMICSRVK